jgi:hypothetical protein
MLLAEPPQRLGMLDESLVDDVAEGTSLLTVPAPSLDLFDAETRRTVLLTARSVIRAL